MNVDSWWWELLSLFFPRRRAGKKKKRKGSYPNTFLVLDPLQKICIKHQPGAANLLRREAVNILKVILPSLCIWNLPTCFFDNYEGIHSTFMTGMNRKPSFCYEWKNCVDHGGADKDESSFCRPSDLTWSLHTKNFIFPISWIAMLRV